MVEIQKQFYGDPLIFYKINIFLVNVTNKR